MIDVLPEWYNIALGEYGVKEIPGELDNPRVQEYLNTCFNFIQHDETSWCSAYVNWCMIQAGYVGTNNAVARSWMKYGIDLTWREWRKGAIVILKRGILPWQGHVGFLAQDNEDGDTIDILGGNQDNMVCTMTFPKSKIIGLRWPHEKYKLKGW